MLRRYGCRREEMGPQALSVADERGPAVARYYPHNALVDSCHVVLPPALGAGLTERYGDYLCNDGMQALLVRTVPRRSMSHRAEAHAGITLPLC